MKADAQNLQRLLHGAHQYVIPAFQRTYVWDQQNWRRLWDDIVALLETASTAEHFMGSMVCMQSPTEPGNSPQFLVIDGQQRLITFVTLLCAIRDSARELGIDDISGEIQDHYLINRFKKGLERYKVVPRLRDRQTIIDLMENENPIASDLISQAYSFFMKAISSQFRPTDEATMRSLYETIVSQIQVVIITLQGENPYMIFETLNSRGVLLEESDLVRNHVFMSLGLTQQDDFDSDYWQPFEDYYSTIPTKNKLTNFYRDFLMHTGDYVRQGTVYITFTKRLEEQHQAPHSIVNKLRSFAQHYMWIYNPESIDNGEVSRELHNLKLLNVSTTNPLVMHLLEQFRIGHISGVDLVSCFRSLQGFIMRRALTGERTRGYGHQFPQVIRELEVSAIVESLSRALHKIGWPSDDSFKKALLERPIYLRNTEIVRLLLVMIEENEYHKEPVNVRGLLAEGKLQIEHILPQTLGDDVHGEAWREALGENWVSLHESLVHTIGNLTLTGYNATLSNSAFEDKRRELGQSHLELNRRISAVETWDAAAIHDRGIWIAERAAKIWPTPM